MFVQIIQGRVSDGNRLRAQLQKWRNTLMPSTTGFLGGTSGISPDGIGVTVARFESAEAAAANSNKSEQDRWWSETEACFDGKVDFAESNDVDLVMEGGSDNAAFVQFIEMKVSDRTRWVALEEEMMATMSEVRPDVLGGLRIWLPSDRLVQVVYFTNEEAARLGEEAELPQEFQTKMDEWHAYSSEMVFIDLRAPLLFSP